MAGEYIFLQSTFDARGYDETFKVTITTDIDTRITRGSIIEFATNEQFGSLTPYVTITFIDANSTLLDRTQIQPHQLFWIGVVRGASRVFETIPMRMTSLEYNNDSSSNTTTQQTTYKLTLVCNSWMDLVSKTYCRGWSNKTYSSVLQEVFSPLFTNVEVGATSTIIDTIVQPHMTNSEFLKDVVRRCDPRTGSMMMVASNLFDDTLTIKSREEFIGDTNPFSNRFIPELTLGGWRDQLDIVGATQDNHGFPDRFMSFGFVNHYSERAINGNNGVRVIVYDNETSQSVDTTVNVHTSGVTSLTNRSTHSDNDSGFESTKYYYRGTDDYLNQVKYELVRNMSKGIELDIITTACELYRLGQIFTITLPSSDDESGQSSLVSMSHSGKYMLTGIIHHFDRMTGEFYSRLKFSREGLAYVGEPYTLIE